MKIIISTLAFVALLTLGLATLASADYTFDPAPGTITAVVEGKLAKISWSGIGEIAYLEQYRHSNRDHQGFKPQFVPVNNAVTIDVSMGDRFQLIDTQDKWMSLTRELAVSRFSDIKLEGVRIDCSDPNGCVLQVK